MRRWCKKNPSLPPPSGGALCHVHRAQPLQIRQRLPCATAPWTLSSSTNTNQPRRGASPSPPTLPSLSNSCSSHNPADSRLCSLPFPCSGRHWLAIEQQGKELSAHSVPARNYGNAREKWFIRIGHDAITKDVNNRGAPRRGRIVRARTVHRSGMVKRTFTLFQLNGNGLEFVFQLFGKSFADAFHFPGQNGFGQVGPFVASWNVIQAAVFPG